MKRRGVSNASVAWAVGLLAAAVAASLVATAPPASSAAASSAAAAGTASEYRPLYGTPGLIAQTSLRGDRPVEVWDVANQWNRTPGKRPEYQTRTSEWTTLVRRTVPPLDFSTGVPTSIAIASTPVWSPDGSRLTFSAEVNYPGTFTWPLGYGRVEKTSAIFVYEVATKQTNQITMPPDSVRACHGRHHKECGVEELPEEGHLLADHAPFWSPDGRQIIFTRMTQAEEASPYYDQEGSGLWIVDSLGGEPRELTNEKRDGFATAMIGVPIPGTDSVVIRTEDSGDLASLRTLDLETGGLGEVIYQSTSRYKMGDFDVSPDGKTLVYVLHTSGNQPGATVLNSHPLVSDGIYFMPTPWPSSFVRWSPTGSGLLKAGCVVESGVDMCGIVEHLMVPVDEYDRRPEEDVRLVFASDDLYRMVNVKIPIRVPLEIQNQQLHTIFLPGFAGSNLYCNGEPVWDKSLGDLAAVGSYLDDLNKLDLRPNGTPVCRSEARGVFAVSSLSVYQSSVDFMEEQFDGLGHHFGWDWRRKPAASTAKLRAFIAEVLSSPHAVTQGHSRVVLYGHSYGGLLIRAYLEESPEQVARVLTAGTPYFGSAKSIFPLVFGVEDPISLSGLDLILDNGDFAQFVSNLEGMYQLYPSASLGESWLHAEGKQLNANTRKRWLSTYRVNARMVDQARKAHADTWDFFWDANGVIDYRAVGGRGIPTPSEVHITTFRGISRGKAQVRVLRGDGDGTVLINSQLQEGVRASERRADVHRQYVCGVPHMALSGDPKVTSAYRDFLAYGSVPAKTDTTGCAPISPVEVTAKPSLAPKWWE